MRENIPELLEAICMKALAHNRADRYATAEEMARALDAALEKLGLRAQLRDVGDLVTRAFADERVRIRGVIEAQMASLRSTGEYPAVDASMAGKSMARAVLPRLEAPSTSAETSSFNAARHGMTGATGTTLADAGSRADLSLSRSSSLTANATSAELLALAAPPAKKPIALYAVVGIAIGVAVAAVAWPRGQSPTPPPPSTVPAAATHMIRIESTPPGATVSENDKVLGQDPDGDTARSRPAERAQARHRPRRIRALHRPSRPLPRRRPRARPAHGRERASRQTHHGGLGGTACRQTSLRADAGPPAPDSDSSPKAPPSSLDINMNR